MDQNQTFKLTVLGCQSQTHFFHGDGRAAVLCLHAAHNDLAAVMGVCTENRLQKFGTACAQHTGDTQNLALMKVEADVGELALPGQVFDFHDHFLTGDNVIGTAADFGLTEHHVDDALIGDLMGVHGTDQLAVTQNGDSVGNLGDLVELVRDINNNDILLFQFADNIEQTFYFAGSQRGGWFIQHQNLGIVAHCLGDLHHLALPHTQAGYNLLGINVHAHLTQQLRCHGICLFPVNHAVPLGHTAQEDVFRNGQTGHQGHFLINRCKTLVVGLRGGTKAQLFAIQEELTLGGLDRAGKAFHQCGFAGAVLAQECMNSAAVKRDAHIIQGQAAGILLGDVLGMQNAH